VLESFWPGAARIFSDLASPIALAFLERYPTPEAAARLGPSHLAGFLAQHRYCGRRSPEALLERLHRATDGCAGEAEAEAKGELVLALARALQALIAELAELTSRIEHLVVAELPDGRVVMSFPRAGRVCAAQILAELGDVRARFPTEDQFAAEAGVILVTHQSGKSRGVGWRWPATSACAPRSPAWPTTPATRVPGPPTSTAARARLKCLRAAPGPRQPLLRRDLDLCPAGVRGRAADDPRGRPPEPRFRVSWVTSSAPWSTRVSRTWPTARSSISEPASRPRSTTCAPCAQAHRRQR
jgi:Transposase IS116/IS110/IS902 family